MNVERLVQMANQIGRFHEGFPDHGEALLGTATHLRRFWDPRMRRELLAHVDARGGAGLSPLVQEAIAAHRTFLEPPPANPPVAAG